MKHVVANSGGKKSVRTHSARALQPSPLLLEFCVTTTTPNSSEHSPHSNCTSFSGSICHSHLEAGPELEVSQKGGLGLAQSQGELSWVILHALIPACMTAPAQAFPQVSAIPLLPSTLDPKSIAAGYQYLWKPCFQLPFHHLLWHTNTVPARLVQLLPLLPQSTPLQGK